jgi:hypothetical protein
MKVRGSCSAVQWDGGLGNVTGIQRGTHLHVWGSACVFGSLPGTLTLLTLLLASTASLLRCEAKQERDRRRRKQAQQVQRVRASASSPSQNWTLWPTLVPPVLFSPFLFVQRVIDETCGRGRRWAWESGFIGVASGCLPCSSSEVATVGGIWLAGWLAAIVIDGRTTGQD